MPFLSPNQQRQSTEGNHSVKAQKAKYHAGSANKLANRTNWQSVLYPPEGVINGPNVQCLVTGPCDDIVF